jgi:hypothetical protein
MTYGPFTITHLVRYAGALGDLNPLHHDPAHATVHGCPGPAIAIFQAGLIGSWVAKHAGRIRYAASESASCARSGWVTSCRSPKTTSDREAATAITVTCSSSSSEVAAQAEIILADAGAA